LCERNEQEQRQGWQIEEEEEEEEETTTTPQQTIF
jgi:hypothetical protein